jgi:dTDP-4-amino-4,6-dideoxygalactose transaminase
LYKGRLVGTMGDVAAFSLMSGKSLACGEGGIMITDDRRVYERALLFGHYARHDEIALDDLSAGKYLPWGGHKYRMHQLTSAMARVQLAHYFEQMAEIDQAMNRFGDLIEEAPGIQEHRPPAGSGLTMGGWYAPLGLYRTEELGGLSITRFCEAVRAEGVPCSPGCNKALHLHPLFNTADVYGGGKPTRVANLPEGVDVRQPRGSLPVAERIQRQVFRIPWFKRFRPEVILEYASAFSKVADRYADLLPDDPGDPPDLGSWGLTRRQGG